MMIIRQVCLLCFVCMNAFRTSSALEDREECITPKNESGICIDINRCDDMMVLTKSAKVNDEVRDHLIRSLCSNSNNTISVCCPTDSLHEDVLPSSPVCGKSTVDEEIGERIVGGEPSKLGAWPWLVALGFKYKIFNDEIKFFSSCGGAIITRRFILTAAHCFQDKKMPIDWARIGVLNLYPPEDGPQPLDIPVAKSIVHEKYNHKRVQDDIALVKLRRPLEYTALIRPICLPKEDGWADNELDGEMPYVAGWGVTEYNGPASNVQLEIQVPITPRHLCTKIFLKKYLLINSNQICAGSLLGDEDACQGDSGGPLMLYHDENDSFYVIGVVSFGYKCAVEGFPGVYTRVARYTNWIRSTIESNL